MALPIRPLQAPITITLCATPFIGTELWQDGITAFHSWLWQTFGEVNTGDYQVARELDVHRLIADEWLKGLLVAKLIEERIFHVGPVSGGDNEAPGFEIIAPTKRIKAEIVVPDELKAYDPWTNREYDDEIDGALHADMFIDKFFLVSCNEHFLIERKIRIRSNGRLFVPVEHKDMPRYAENPLAPGQAAPARWQAVIDDKASGEAVIRRRKARG